MKLSLYNEQAAYPAEHADGSNLFQIIDTTSLYNSITGPVGSAGPVMQRDRQ